MQRFFRDIEGKYGFWECKYTAILHGSTTDCTAIGVLFASDGTIIIITHCICIALLSHLKSLLTAQWSVRSAGESEQRGALLRSLYRERAEPQGKALDLPVDLRLYPHLWSDGPKGRDRGYKRPRRVLSGGWLASPSGTG